MSEEKEMTAPNVSIGVDTEQSSIKQTTTSISNRDANFNPFDEFFKKIDPSYMKTVTMQELYQDIYSKKPPVIEACSIRVLICLSVHLRSAKASLWHSLPIMSAQVLRFGTIL